MTSKERIITPTIAADGSRHYQSVTSPPDDSIAVCYMIPDRIIPIVFVPGVMGTNLEDLKKNSVWLVNSSTSLLGWIGKSPIERKKILDKIRNEVRQRRRIERQITIRSIIQSLFSHRNLILSKFKNTLTQVRG